MMMIFVNAILDFLYCRTHMYFVAFLLFSLCLFYLHLLLHCFEHVVKVSKFGLQLLVMNHFGIHFNCSISVLYHFNKTQKPN